ncbi:hypothetical protein TELCIR_17198, partial [Teladorsagia circumcincta]
IMVERELVKSEDCDATSLPITALCIVSDKNKCPRGFTPNPGIAKVRGEDGVPFKLNPQLAAKLKTPV